MSKHSKGMKLGTIAIHGGPQPDPRFGAVNVPIYQSSTFAFENAEDGAAKFKGERSGYIYTRIGNPTINALEEVAAELEGGCCSVALSSGMGAMSTLCFAVLKQGDHVVATHSLYGPSRLFIEKHMSRYGVTSTFLDTSDVQAVKDAIRPETKMIYIETPANPTMLVSDIQALAQVAHEAGAILVVDNTFASPILQRPLSLGADIVLHSVTKFINGHSDVVGGLLIAKDKEWGKKLRMAMKAVGTNMDPHQAYLVVRGIKTLKIRVLAAQENAKRMARLLDEHPAVEWVKYPGLDSHPQKDLVDKQMDGPGSLIAFELKGGYEAGKKLLDNIQIPVLAVSLGGVESLIQHPASMTHASMNHEERLSAGITDGLIRFSVGIEDGDDLIEDMRRVLDMLV